jgi:hypothetical protein
MNAPQAPASLDQRRARNRRLALVLGLVAAAFYIGFIALGAVQGHG